MAVVCAAGGKIKQRNMSKKIYFLFVIVVILTSCLSGKLMYIDDWEGVYVLRENNPCCDSAVKVRLRLTREMVDKYSWKLFFTGGSNSDTISGKAVYEKKQLQFFVSDVELANRYFKRNASVSSPLFRMEYDNYYTEKGLRYVDHFTRWYNELREYQQVKTPFAGVSYHFKKNDSKAPLLIGKHGMKDKR